MSKQVFSSLNCMKFNDALVKLKLEPDWENIFQDATNMTQANVASIKAEEKERHEIYSNNLRVEENLRNEKKQELNREVYILLVNKKLIPNKESSIELCFKKWGKIKREFSNGKDGRSLTQLLLYRSIITYFYQEKGLT